MTEILVIGYGNTLRSDDGAGQRVAELVAEWKLPNVRSLPLLQLTPDLTKPISEAKLVIFVDVYRPWDEPSLLVNYYHYAPPLSYLKNYVGQVVSPLSLLTLSQFIYNCVSPTCWISIPVFNFEFGEGLSPMAEIGIQNALTQILLLDKF